MRVRMLRTLSVGLVLMFGAAGSIANGETSARAAHGSHRAFSAPLRIPRVIKPHRGKITLPARPSGVSIFPGPKTPMWTFGGSFPGPTIVTRSGRKVRVRVVNELPRSAESITVHLHGGHHRSVDDGQPTRYLIPRGRARTYTYPLVTDGSPSRGALLWYHDHRMGVTGRDIWKGLAGMFVVRDRLDRRLSLPKNRYDVPLMITDRTFDERNHLPYPSAADTDPPGDFAVGDHVLVNGVPQPYFKVADRRYRLRILNASNFTSYNLRLGDDRPFTQVGTGQGLLPQPVKRDRILLGPAQRVDVVVDFNGLLGERVVLESVPRPPTEVGTGSPATSIMQFRVVRDAEDPSRVPADLRPLPGWVENAPEIPDRMWAFGLGTDAGGATAWTINGQTFDPNRIDAEVERDSIETWELVNTTTNVSHLIHMHGVPFVALARNGQSPPEWERALDDTFRIDPGERLSVAAKFADYTGTYVLHCHMLEHEDHGMMAQFKVIPPSSE